ncbi:MAG: NifT/FixU family protein [Hydrogenothermaceae bacterium]|nr:NifT/FixU family protein [Hydrogenothermaceae bacterium]
MTLRKANDRLSVYISKKDLEIDVIDCYKDENKFILKLSNGCELRITDDINPYEVKLPKTINVTKIGNV